MNFNHFIIPKSIQKELDKDAITMNIIVRFPPEPSGYLHIGHVKALYINACVAKKYSGRLIIRMDDTNPLLESIEYENGILEDLTKLGINITEVTHSSDNFEKLLEFSLILIKDNKAYIDLSDSEIIKQERSEGIESKFRNNTIEENLVLWNQFKNGELKGCLRMKTNMMHKNYAMRDFVLFRPINMEHHRTKNKFKIYPTYDFACPILDSLENITHVFRSVEYNERDEQNDYILEALKLRKPKLFHYGKFMIEGAELSKRKIKEAILKGKYSGWDDPNLYTMRGLFSRGLNIEALEEIMKDTGYSVSDIIVDPKKIWTINKKYIDKISTRYMAIENPVIINIIITDNDTYEFKTSQIDRFIKNPILGKRNIDYTSEVYIENTDKCDLVKDEEITLLNYMNVIYDNKNFKSNTSGDYRKTKKKILWVSNNYTKLSIYFCDLNLQKNFIGEADMINLKIGDYVQIFKLGYFKCTSNQNNIVKLIDVHN